MFGGRVKGKGEGKGGGGREEGESSRRKMGCVSGKPKNEKKKNDNFLLFWYHGHWASLGVTSQWRPFLYSFRYDRKSSNFVPFRYVNMSVSF